MSLMFIVLAYIRRELDIWNLGYFPIDIDAFFKCNSKAYITLYCAAI